MKYTKLSFIFLCLLLTLSACGDVPASADAASPPAGGAEAGSLQDTGDPAMLDLFSMDTFMSFQAYGADAESALWDVSAMITSLDSQLSVTNESSEIYQVNHASGASVTLSSATADLLSKALTLGRSTDGALELTSYPLSRLWGFTTGEYQIPTQSQIDSLLPLVDDSQITLSDQTVTIPDGAQLDLGAVAKGYAGDQAAEILQSHGVSSALLNLGSSTIRAIGTKPDGSDWRIAIQDPEDSSAYAGVVSISDRSVNTSGGYERYFEGEDGKIYWHILDPKTGYPADSGLRSVTILSDSALTGDGLSTALFVMGLDKAVSYWQDNGGFDFILITADGEIYLTEGAEACFSPLGKYVNAPLHVIRQAD